MSSSPPVVEIIDDAMAEMLRGKTEVERLQIAGRMWRSARVMLRAVIRSEHPEWDAQHLNQEIACRISHGLVSDECQ